MPGLTVCGLLNVERMVSANFAARVESLCPVCAAATALAGREDASRMGRWDSL
jgi:hypothetical protein